MFHIQTSTDLDALLGEADSWNSLTRGVPFRDVDWLASWWRHLGSPSTAHVVVARDDDGQLRGILPLYRRGNGRTLANLGDGDACSDYVSVLAAEADAVLVARQIGQHLLATTRDADLGWDVIELDGVVEGDEPIATLVQVLKTGGAAIHAQSRMSTWILPAHESWEHHLASHGKSRRRKLRALAKRLQDEPALRQRTADSHAEVDQLIDALIELHQRRWTAAGEAGSYADPCFQDFIRESAHRFFDRGVLQLAAIERNGHVIAVELNVIGGNRIMYSYSSGFDLDHAEVEPGRMLSVCLMQSLYENRLAGIDFLRGDEDYKQRDASKSRRVFQLRAVAPAWLPKLRHAVWNTQFELKQFARRRSGRQPIAVVDLQ
jgi:CelD/BcsL family acetyltransferase involved in cellulose biosynthesis